MPAKDKFVFEEALARAEAIAMAIERGEVGLEDSIRQFEEGMALIRRCRQVLDAAELRIQQLQAADGGGAKAGEPGPDIKSET